MSRLAAKASAEIRYDAQLIPTRTLLSQLIGESAVGNAIGSAQLVIGIGGQFSMMNVPTGVLFIFTSWALKLFLRLLLNMISGKSALFGAGASGTCTIMRPRSCPSRQI